MPPTYAKLPAGITFAATPEQLFKIKTRQLRVGPGAPITSYRKHGIVCNNCISPKVLRFVGTADGSCRWTPQQAYMIKHRNNPELDGLPRKKQIEMLRAWASQEDRAHLRRNADFINARLPETLETLRKEEFAKREHRVNFAFIGSGKSFWSCPSNFCRFFELTGAAPATPLADLKKQGYIPRHVREAREEARGGPKKRRKPKRSRKTGLLITPKRNRGSKGSNLVLDKFTLNLFDRSGDFTRPKSERELSHWWHHGVLYFQQMDPELQALFSIKPGEKMGWLEPNSSYALYIRWARRAKALPEYAHLRRDPRALAKLLGIRYRQATVAELMDLLDTSHTAKFPMLEYNEPVW